MALVTDSEGPRAVTTNARTPHYDPRAERLRMASLKNWGEVPQSPGIKQMRHDVVLDCGWGRLVFAQTFASGRAIADILRRERPGSRDIAFYLRDPHVVLAQAPQDLFLDPSHAFRLWFDRYRTSARRPQGFFVRMLRVPEDCGPINRIYQARGMVPLPDAFLQETRNSRTLTWFVTEDADTGALIGVVMGVDHVRAFNDPDNGSSLWALAVDPQTTRAGVGEALSRHLAEHFLAKGRTFMDLSVMHDNTQAIALYEKLNFERVPVFCLKNKNSINEKLFIGPAPEAKLNPYARIITDEARRRGISVDVLDEDSAFFQLSLGGRAITCRESLSELTSAVAMSRCDDKAVTRRLLRAHGLAVPDQVEVTDDDTVAAFLAKHGRVVVKPARGEQGRGISVDLSTLDEVDKAITVARTVADTVLMEQFVEGQDLRIIVIDYKVVAGAVRRPAGVVGDGRTSVRALIETQSRRRAAATGGESRIPQDSETERCLGLLGLTLDSVPEAGRQVQVRKTANLHTGGTIHDVTDRLHRVLVDAAVTAARAIEIPVVGLDFMVPSPFCPDYVIIEANERPGLANHEPQPTAERFIDLLFPRTRYAPLSATGS